MNVERPHDRTPARQRGDRTRATAVCGAAAAAVFLALVASCAGAPGTGSPDGSSAGRSRATAEPPEASGDEASGASGGGTRSAPPLPACARAGPAVDPPPGFPRDFPFPPGTVVTTSRVTEAGAAYVEAYVPGTMQEAVVFFLDALPAAGFEHGRGDSEAHEAESAFRGNGVDGHWLVATLTDCPDAVALAVVTVPSQ